MVQSLLVFICDSNYHALEYAAWSSQLTYLTRCFIMTEKRLDVNKINWKKQNDIFLKDHIGYSETIDIFRPELLFNSNNNILINNEDEDEDEDVVEHEDEVEEEVEIYFDETDSVS